MAEVLQNKSLDAELAKMLISNETILAVAQTTQSAIVATNLRVIILKTAAALGGAGKGHFFGNKTSSYHYQQITSVDLSKQFMAASVVVRVPGLPTMYQKGSLGEVPNHFFYPWKIGGSAQPLEQVVEIIRQQIALVQEAKPMSSSAAPASQTPPDIPEQIKQLAALRDAGVLTNEEFERKKAELLARM